MASGKVKIWNSIVTRFGLFFIGLIILAIFVSGFLIYNRASAIIGTFSQERIAHSSNLAEQAFYSLLSEVENDISIMAENAKLQAYADAPTPTLQTEIEHLFYVTLKNKPNYFQVRLISLIEEGQEIIRLDKKGNEVIPTRKNKLQNKRDRPYFQEALNLKPSEFYFSLISLNEEFGVVSPSLTPTIRAVSLVYNTAQTPTHMVVINLDLRNFYTSLKNIMTSGIELMLIDQYGQYLFASDMTKCFSKQLKSYERFDADFAIPFSTLHTDSSRFETLKSKKGNIFLSEIKSIAYSNGKHQIFLLAFLKENIALSSVLYIKKYSYQIIPIVALAALVIAVIFIRILALRIGSITEAIGSYDQASMPTIKFSENRKDELGVLTRTFMTMKARISQQMDDLKCALDKEQKAIKEKDEFLQNMSHELRTPLNAILGLTQLIKKNKPNPKQEPIVDAIHRSAQSLAGLMHDILDHQKLLEGRVHLKYKPAKISELLSDIHASYRFDAINKGLGFELKIDAELKENWYQTDALRFTQIITNLIVNAIKFTDSGKVTIDVNVERSRTLEIKIADTGKGILPENLKKIRERFYQEEPSQSSTEGFGLGLSIVKQLVDLFAGELLVKSEMEMGSIFTVKLPLLIAEERATNSSVMVDHLSLSDIDKTMTILHIEDDESARLLINQLIQSPNVELEQTNNWAYAQQFIEKQMPDLIISDLMLESVDVSSKLVSIKEKHDIPIIVMSALEEPQMQLISHYYLQKPYDLDQMMDLAILLLGKSIFDQPQLATNYAQYDQDKTKIKKFLSLLISEFEAYVVRIDQAFENQDETEWIAIKHKLITHIRSLALHKLNEHIPNQLVNLDDQKRSELKKLLQYNLSYFRNELRLL
ncbi:Signal transduction histidine kinase [Reichenbachiella faecimaris]|uniref:histidine kinase n=1 Tax=Reichenbachiella faecimaris TaxID=692418 RepID=A0A1W2GBR8_REIFA|nr:hybrid sensor histidine kinase/response regulator [Reichenbachiella faecimaris]SMD34073.1 Signal transduction histidine kinase [Reichenbachiella faecimaris]